MRWVDGQQKMTIAIVTKVVKGSWSVKFMQKYHLGWSLGQKTVKNAQIDLEMAPKFPIAVFLSKLTNSLPNTNSKTYQSPTSVSFHVVPFLFSQFALIGESLYVIGKLNLKFFFFLPESLIWKLLKNIVSFIALLRILPKIINSPFILYVKNSFRPHCYTM